MPSDNLSSHGARDSNADLLARRQLRRTVGPTAWMVLDELILDAASEDDGRGRVATNVRRLSIDLGISKDAVARALRRLAEHGLVLRVDERRGRSGRFGPSVYVLDWAAMNARHVLTRSDGSAARRAGPSTSRRGGQGGGAACRPASTEQQPRLFVFDSPLGEA